MGMAGKSVFAELLDVAFAFLSGLERCLPVPFPEKVVVDVEARAVHPERFIVSF
jgi:hypothetical protein